MYIHVPSNIGMWLNVSVTQSIITGYLRHLGIFLFLTQVGRYFVHDTHNKTGLQQYYVVYFLVGLYILYIIIYMRIRVIHYLASVLIWHQYLFIWREVAYHRRFFGRSEMVGKQSRYILTTIKKTDLVGRGFHDISTQFCK